VESRARAWNVLLGATMRIPMVCLVVVLGALATGCGGGSSAVEEVIEGPALTPALDALSAGADDGFNVSPGGSCYLIGTDGSDFRVVFSPEDGPGGTTRNSLRSAGGPQP
jgi:hypothetical protein